MEIERTNIYRENEWMNIRSALCMMLFLFDFIFSISIICTPKDERNIYVKMLFYHTFGIIYLIRVIVSYEYELQTKYISCCMFWRTSLFIAVVPMTWYIQYIDNKTIKLISETCQVFILLISIILYIVWIFEIHQYQSTYTELPVEMTPVNNNDNQENLDNRENHMLAVV